MPNEKTHEAEARGPEILEDSGDADRLYPHDCRFPTRLLDCQEIDRTTTSAGWSGKVHGAQIPLLPHFRSKIEKHFSARTESMMHGDEKSVKQSEMSVGFFGQETGSRT
ncbi:MAG: hypothetical protein P4L10_04805 [Acidobacteriaceae bacterium]|jgi:hypothetical protein|nr:hypothetical protein [Acidobacteriaceae bacterium]